MTAETPTPVRPSIVLIGSVRTSRVTLDSLLREGADVRAVFGLAEAAADRVSDYARLDGIAADHGIPYMEFARVNDPLVHEAVARHAPDALWVIGLSQLIGPAMLSLPRLGCVGFHPTRLPTGRGRAAMAWSILADIPLAATFFLIDDGVHSGPILSQVDVAVEPGDDVAARYDKLCDAIPTAVAEVCARFAGGLELLTPQDERAASYLGARRPSDGTIDWERSTDAVVRLVRASGAPHPGAWTYDRETPIRVDACHPAEPGRHVGVPGRIVEVRHDDSFVVATGDGAATVVAHHADGPWKPKPGIKLGFDTQSELHRLRQRMRALESIVARLVAATGEAPDDSGKAGAESSR